MWSSKPANTINQLVSLNNHHEAAHQKKKEKKEEDLSSLEHINCAPIPTYKHLQIACFMYDTFLILLKCMLLLKLLKKINKHAKIKPISERNQNACNDYGRIK